MPSDLNIFIGLGQSNMSGAGLVSEFPASIPVYGSRLYNYKLDGTWQTPPVEPLHDPTDAIYPALINASVGVGPLLFFADMFARYHPTLKIGLVPCGVGGTTITEWQRPFGGTDVATLYGASRARWEAAAASGTIKGVIVYQGEADSHSTADANAWAAKFATLCADLRTDIGDSNLPIVFVQIGPCSAAHLISDPDWTVLQDNQARIFNKPRTAMVGIKDVSLVAGALGDVHISTAAQQICGERIAQAFRILGACK